MATLTIPPRGEDGRGGEVKDGATGGPTGNGCYPAGVYQIPAQISQARAERFAAMGWGTMEGVEAEPQPQAVKLAIDNVKHKVS